MSALYPGREPKLYCLQWPESRQIRFALAESAVQVCNLIRESAGWTRVFYAVDEETRGNAWCELHARDSDEWPIKLVVEEVAPGRPANDPMLMPHSSRPPHPIDLPVVTA